MTDRRGGRSRSPYDTFNLGDHVGDEPADVAANRGRVARELGVPEDRLVWMSQVHGTGVAVVDGPQAGPVAATDALVTATRGLVLCVLVADCVPILLADHETGVVAAVHAGREGIRQGVVPAALSAMASLGARARHVTALLGPAVCGACYEVPEAMQADVARVAPSAAVRTRRGTPGLDLRVGVEETCARPASPTSSTTRAARSRTRTCSPTAATASRVARPGWSGSADPRAWEDRDMTDLAETCVRCGRGSTPPRVGRPGPVVRRAPRGEQDVAGGRRPGARRAGQRDFGETRAQELIAKAPALADLPVRWHFIGQLQRNKAAAVARLGAVVHTVDRESLVRALDRVGRDDDRPVEVLVQVDLGGAAGELASRGGAAPGDVPALADVVAESPGVRLRGLMAVAPRGRTPRRHSSAWPSRPRASGPTIREPWSCRRA